MPAAHAERCRLTDETPLEPTRVGARAVLRCATQVTSTLGRMKELWIVLGVFGGWLLLQLVVLPRLGIGT